MITGIGAIIENQGEKYNNSIIKKMGQILPKAYLVLGSSYLAAGEIAHKGKALIETIGGNTPSIADIPVIPIAMISEYVMINEIKKEMNKQNYQLNKI